MIRNYLTKCDIVDINSDVCERTILLRRNYKLKLPDAIVAATAMTYNATLITADVGLYRLEGGEGLRIVRIDPLS